MAAIAENFERHGRVASRAWITYVLTFAFLIVLLLTIRALGSTSVGSPTSRPQTGPPVTVIAPVSGGSVR